MHGCSRCNSPALYTRRYSGERLCRFHFRESVINKVSRTISKYRMIKHGDRVGVAVSGGKDSLSLLLILAELCKRKDIDIVAITIDEGIAGYRDEAILNASEVARKLSIEHIVFSYKELFGLTLDTVLESERRDFSSCSFCGVMRRRAIDEAAARAGVNVVATAHNLDDFVQTFLMNLLHGDIEKLGFMNPNYYDEKFPLRRIKPMMEIYEEETALFAYLSGIPFQSVSCPYMHEGLRSEVRDFLNEMEANHPGMKYVFFNSCMEIISGLKVSKENSRPCAICGKPSSSGICGACRMRQLVKKS
jgi:cytoplasmic tRNA 2-thiolation protein 1